MCGRLDSSGWLASIRRPLAHTIQGGGPRPGHYRAGPCNPTTVVNCSSGFESCLSARVGPASHMAREAVHGPSISNFDTVHLHRKDYWEV